MRSLNTIKLHQVFPAISLMLLLVQSANAQTSITDCGTGANGLQSVAGGLAGSYLMANDIDCAGVGTFPISGTFSGTFDGGGYVITGLQINNGTNADTGLFSVVSGTVQNVGLVEVEVTGGNNTGALVGRVTAGGTISKVWASGTVTSATGTNVGGIIGSAIGTATLSTAALGSSNTNISEMYSLVRVKGGEFVGGLIGDMNDAVLTNSYAAPDSVFCGNEDCSAGGAIGNLQGSDVVTSGPGNARTQGLQSVSNVYVAASRVVSTNLGGAAKNISAGLVAVVNDAMPASNSYYNSTTLLAPVENPDPNGAGALTSAQMQSSANFTGWNFSTVWGTDSNVNSGFPYLRWFVGKPSLNTNKRITVTATTAMLRATGIEMANAPLTEKGFVLSTSPNPTVADIKVVDETLTGGAYAHRATGLTPNTTYYYRAFARNSRYTSYGSAEYSFITGINTITVNAAGWRMMSVPAGGGTLADLLAEIWTQGATGGSTANGTPNVYTYDAANQTWSGVTNLNVAPSAGTGLLVYVFNSFRNTYDNGSTFPITLTMNTLSEDTTDAAVTPALAQDQWFLASNPFSLDIDIDSLGFGDQWNTTTYIYDGAISSWRQYNSTTQLGDITGGMVSPYQSFFVQAAALTSQFQIPRPKGRGHSRGASFYKSEDFGNGSAIALEFTANGVFGVDRTFISFMDDAEAGKDGSDAVKLVPFDLRDRLQMMSYVPSQEDSNKPGEALSIQNLPLHFQGELSVPFEIFPMTPTTSGAYISDAQRVELEWDATRLKRSGLKAYLVDRVSGETIDLHARDSYAFMAEGGEVHELAGEHVYPSPSATRFALTFTRSELGTTVEEPGAPMGELPTQLTLEQNYPNPFNPSTQIRFAVPQSAPVTLEVFEVTGRKVATLLDGTRMNAGWHVASFDASNLGSGTYVYRIQSAGTTQTRTMVLVR